VTEPQPPSDDLHHADDFYGSSTPKPSPLAATLTAQAIKDLDLLSTRSSSLLERGQILLLSAPRPSHPNTPHLLSLFELSPLHVFNHERQLHLLVWTTSALLHSFATAATEPRPVCPVGPSRASDSAEVLQLFASLLPDDQPQRLAPERLASYLEAARRLAPNLR